MKNESTLISIIVPVYNCEDVLPKCLESIEKQTFSNLDIIIVNDGSTDNSLSVIMQRKRLDKRIKVVNQENKGVSSARNHGMEVAQGEFITFVDADDFLALNYIEELYNVLCNQNADICFCDWFVYNAESAKDINAAKLSNSADGNASMTECFSATHGFNYMKEKYYICSAWGVLYKSTLIRHLKFSMNLYVGEDALFVAQAVKKSTKIVYLDKKLYYYIIYKNSAMHGSYDEKKFTEISAWERICECFEDVPQVCYSAKCRYAIVCISTIAKYVEEKSFKDNYYLKIMSIYKKNLKYLLKHPEISLIKKIAAISFIVFPKAYIILKTINEQMQDLGNNYVNMTGLQDFREKE